MAKCVIHLQEFGSNHLNLCCSLVAPDERQGAFDSLLQTMVIIGVGDIVVTAVASLAVAIAVINRLVAAP